MWCASYFHVGIFEWCASKGLWVPRSNRRVQEYLPIGIMSSFIGFICTHTWVRESPVELTQVVLDRSSRSRWALVDFILTNLERGSFIQTDEENYSGQKCPYH